MEHNLKIKTLHGIKKIIECTTVKTVNSACLFTHGQIKEPDSLKRLKNKQFQNK